MKKTYKERLQLRAEKELSKYNLYQYDYLVVIEYTESSYKDNREGFLSYLENLFFKKHNLTLEEYQRLFDLA